MVNYSVKTGLWKSLKNMLVVLAPALVASWATLIANLPPEYQTYALPIGGFVGYLFKNWFQLK